MMLMVGYASSLWAWACWLSQLVMATTELSTTELSWKMVAAPVPAKPQSWGTSQEVAAKTASILPWVSNGRTGLTP